MNAFEVNEYLIKYGSTFAGEKVILLILEFKPLSWLCVFGHCLLVGSK